MANRAYDVDLKDIVFAEKTTKKERGKFLCFNSDCCVEVFHRTTEGVDHFVTYKDVKHIDGCDFIISYNRKYYKAQDHNFNLSVFFDGISSSNQKSNQQSNINEKNEKSNASSINLNTLLQLYKFCRTNLINHSINGILDVGDICIDERNIHQYIYRHMNNDIKLIIGTISTLNWNKNFMEINIQNEKIKYPEKFRLYFPDKNFFESFRNKLENFGSKKYDRNEGVGIKIIACTNFFNKSLNCIINGKGKTFNRNCGDIINNRMIRIMASAEED